MNSINDKRIGNQYWGKVSKDEVYCAFLKSEYKIRFNLSSKETEYIKELVDNPCFSNEFQNSKREELLLLIRKPILDEITHTTWHKASLQQSHLNELRVMGRCGWDYGSLPDHDSMCKPDQNELVSVARRRPQKLKKDPFQWEPPILWGHTMDGPFTIIDGTHRLLGYASHSNKPDLNILAYIGLSEEKCKWHLLDQID